MKNKDNLKKKIKVSNTNVLLRKTFERAKMVSVGNSKMFLTFLNKLSFRVVLLATMTNLEGARNRVKMIHNFGQYLVLMNKNKGPDYVIAYLKASQLAISKYLAREPLGSLMEVNPNFIFPRLASGLPKIIGPRDRVSLRHNNYKVIILWMSIFGLFRVLTGTYKLKISTISNPFSGNKDFLTEKSLLMASLTRDKLWALRGVPKPNWDGIRLLSTDTLQLFQTSSPSSKVSWTGALIDVRSLQRNGIDSDIVKWMELTRSGLLESFVDIRDKLWPRQPKSIPVACPRVAWFLDKNQARDSVNNPFPGEWSEQVRKELPSNIEVLFITNPTIPREQQLTYMADTDGPMFFKNESAIDQVGQVQFVKEPAGKLRVFAMVDVWTQSIMHPLHKLLTSILRDIPNDGTLNQTLSYERARKKSIMYNCSYGYDLSAATDRLPIQLQVSILQGVFESIGIPTDTSKELARLWKEILVNRAFLIPKLPKGVEDPQELALSSIYYEVGQPMGALSSFNMLALTHHMVMQDIASSFGMEGWCELYEITGDDISIFDSRLASTYVEYMSSLGLEINQKKSVVSVSKATGEYLKKTWIKDLDVSQISWKQLYQNSATLMGRVSDALYFLQKWNTHKITVPGVVRRASLPWDRLKSNNRDDINIPLLALLSTALRQSKLPLEKFFLFLMGQKDRSLEFKSLYSHLSKLQVKREEIELFLTQFFRKEEIKFPDTKDWKKREIAFSSPLRGLRLSVIAEIMRLQKKLHGGGIDAGKFPKQEPMADIFKPGAKMSSGFKFRLMSEPKPMMLLSSDWVREQTVLMVDRFIGCQLASTPKPASRPGGWKYDQRWIVEDLLNRCVIQPALARYIRSILKYFPKLHPARPFIAEKDLQSTDLDTLLKIMDLLVNLETMLLSHKVIDLDRKVAHKASLSILSKLKPAKTVHKEEFSFMGMGFGGGMGLGGGGGFGLKF